jgi:hypothetical protein
MIQPSFLGRMSIKAINSLSKVTDYVQESWDVIPDSAKGIFLCTTMARTVWSPYSSLSTWHWGTNIELKAAKAGSIYC